MIPPNDKKDEEDKGRPLSPVDKEAQTKETNDDTKKEDAKQDMDIEEGEVNEDGNEKEKISNESSKMSDPNNPSNEEEEEEEVDNDDAMDEVQY